MSKCRCKDGRCFLRETKQGDSTYACDSECYLSYTETKYVEAYEKRYPEEFNNIVEKENKDE